MADKYILLAGQQIPINCEAPVHTYDAGGFSFYNPQGTASQSSWQNMMARRPSGRVYSNRPGGFRRDLSQLPAITPEELDRLRETVYQVVIHHDVTFTSEKCFNVLVSRGLSTHFMINHDGALYQALDIYHASWATGVNNGNCIAIDLNNPVKLSFADKDPANPPRQVFQGRVNGPMKVGLGYTEAQYATLIALFRAFVTPLRIQKTHWIPMKGMARSFFPPMNAEGEVINRLIRGHQEFVGFMGHWHCEAQKWDPGPGFDWYRVLAGVHGERNSFPVLLEGGHNLADLQGQGLSDLLEQYYTNIEANETGGWYPLGANQSWHSGVHIHVDKGKPVQCMSKGTIVAVRNAKRVDLGDPGFVVVRHEKEADVTVVEGEEVEPIYWWSVYMHLGRMEKEEQLADIPWVRALLGDKLQPPQTTEFDLSGLETEGFPREKLPPKVADGTQPAKFDAKPFWDGDIILCEIPVESGEHIGYVGEFGTNEWNLEPQIHVEIISKQNLFADAKPTAGRSWLLVEGDLDDNSLINIERVVRPILSQQVSFDAESNSRVLKTSEIQLFFVDGSAGSARRQFRRMITVHKSEWSPQMDWTKTAASAVGWQWETQEAFSRWLITWVPFQWMTPDVTGHCGFPEDHRFYTYHPIYFLDFLNQSYSGSGEATAEGVDESELTAAQARAKKLEGELMGYQNRIAAGEELTVEEQARYDELLVMADRHFGEGGVSDVTNADEQWFYDGSFDEWEPGEWEPPEGADGGF